MQRVPQVAVTCSIAARRAQCDGSHSQTKGVHLLFSSLECLRAIQSALCTTTQEGQRLEQLGLSFHAKSRRGGARRGAGRPKGRAHLRQTPHRVRPVHRAAHPVHVTLRAESRSLREQQVVRTVLGALRDSRRDSFRIVHYSVQANHLHLIVEAADSAALSSAMRGLMVRVARRVNRLLFARGRFWADRWHGQPLTSPRQVRNALLYVIQNRNKHDKNARPSLDPLSSAQWFNGFARPVPVGFQSMTPQANAPPRTWLLNIGWRRHGLIDLSEAPRH
jgi:REP element-mobilizing transposase RayT